MPELPEVEVIRRQLEPLLVGRVIGRVQASGASNLFATPPAALIRGLRGRTILALQRRGKYLIAALDDGAGLLLHLGMTGQLLVDGAAKPPAPAAHTHLRLGFRDRGPRLYFRDVRRFGRVQLLRGNREDSPLSKLGPDALLATADALHAAARRRRSAVKALLLDQSVIAGLGNIYADEILFLAGVRPSRRASLLSLECCSRLMRHAKQVLRSSIRAGGTTISDYVQPDGSGGTYQHQRLVYGRTGEPCRSCGARIRRVVIAQRSAHYCPKCQH